MKSVKNHLTRKNWDQVRDKVEYEVLVRVRTTVWREVEYKVWNQVAYQVGFQSWSITQ